MTREKKMQFPANRDGRPGPHRGRVVRPDALGGKACWAYTSTVPVGQSGIRAAHRGLDAPVRRHPFRRLKSHWSTPKIPGFLIREFPQGGNNSPWQRATVAQNRLTIRSRNPEISSPIGVLSASFFSPKLAMPREAARRDGDADLRQIFKTSHS